MLFMNEHEVDCALRDFHPSEAPNLARGAQTLASLVYWTNGHSDGWHSWPKPAASAKRLMELLQAGQKRDREGDLTDCSPSEVIAAERPIKAFLTRRRVPHS